SCDFFFSSRRRHTRSDRDWSSDVCSSDLKLSVPCGSEMARIASPQGTDSLWFDAASRSLFASASDGSISIIQGNNNQFSQSEQRSEERRVGKECRARGWAEQ